MKKYNEYNRYDVCHGCEYQQRSLSYAPCCDCEKLALEDEEIRKEEEEEKEEEK